MKSKKFLMLISIMLMGCFVTACKPSAGFDLISNYTLTGMEVQENKILVEGRLHSSALIVDHYSSRIEGNAMYIKSTIRKGEKVSGNGTTTTEDTNNLELRKHLSIYFEAKLPNNIEKIFMEDSNHQIMIWEKDQGYGRFEIEDLWKEEVKKIKNKE